MIHQLYNTNNYYPSSAAELSLLYKSISQNVTTTTCLDPWPMSKNFVQQLDYDTVSNIYKPTSFEQDGQGPFGIMALFNDELNAACVPLITTLLDVFQEFVTELDQYILNLITTSKLSSSSDCAGISCFYTDVPHLTVAVFQEHPKILPPSQQQLWMPTSEATLHLLTNKLDTFFQNNFGKRTNDTKIVLELDSILLTTDGAMIAGFVDNSIERNYFNLKQQLIESAIEFFETIEIDEKKKKNNQGLIMLTSRPKRLIHITLGRVLTIDSQQQQPTSNNDDAKNCYDDSTGSNNCKQHLQQEIKTFIQHYNDVVLPYKVQQLKKSSNDNTSGCCLHIKELTFLRNQIWFCIKNKVYKTWNLP